MKTILITESVFLVDAAFQKRPNPVPTHSTRRIACFLFCSEAPTTTNDNAKCMHFATAHAHQKRASYETLFFCFSDYAPTPALGILGTRIVGGIGGVGGVGGVGGFGGSSTRFVTVYPSV